MPRDRPEPAPVLHLCAKRFTPRRHAVTDIKAYTNLGAATLYVNNRKVGTAKADGINRVVWSGVKLAKGENTIRVEAGTGRGRLQEECKVVSEE